ncbi:DUF2336 domain-containing protein [Terasakiella sp. A23]|uniref:DUF2336 domain-containing protein n=1 Tax=Terasakiella sp. FCG-A23 TaxID=3080561 RepID=UPI002952FA4E|nr:DUF2336 domain-containing protein [Terasakiella sp. A23]MDV7341306.1 DUF2336 domain-containing protein [Terasakiella sp. A23]
MSNADKRLVTKDTLSYAEMQKLASHENLAIRCQLAERQDLKPEILYFLAEDDNMEVRRRIAVNPTTPRQADLLLARDKDEAVRLELTEKIANLAPDVSAAEQSKIQTLTYDALKLLSQDQATKVRQILSETLKDVVDAPGDIIKHLARDMEVVVAGPVLQFSPVLTDDDLLEIIDSTHAKGALNAISKRESVSESISEAVIATNVESAIADLLSNNSAQIREDTLDMLAESAESVEAWHAPLTQRPKLSAKAANRMAHYLADNLLTTLQERKDLPDEVLDTVKEVVKQRIDADEAEEEETVDPIDEVRELKEKGELTEERLGDWLDNSEWLYATSALAVMADMRRVTIKKVLASQSGKGLMALAWKAGLSAQMGESIQFKLAKVPVKNLLKATEDGNYPLDEDELSWHLELFGDS